MFRFHKFAGTLIIFWGALFAFGLVSIIIAGEPVPVRSNQEYLGEASSWLCVFPLLTAIFAVAYGVLTFRSPRKAIQWIPVIPLAMMLAIIPFIAVDWAMGIKPLLLFSVVSLGFWFIARNPPPPLRSFLKDQGLIDE